MEDSQQKGNSVNDLIFDSQDDFFSALEHSVNGLVADAPMTRNEEPQIEQDSAQAVTPNDGAVWESEENPYKKRYQDSSRENSRNQGQNQDNAQYSALINVMKKDPKLVGVVKNYLEGGGKTPQNFKEAIGVPEDFIFDADEAFGNPGSDSSKMFNGVVNGIVQKKIDATVSKMQQQNAQEAHEAQLQGEASAFMEKTGMNKSQFEDMMRKAGDKTMTYDDINLIVNREANNKNVAKNTKKDVLAQMKKAQATPTSMSGQGSVDSTDVTHEDKVFGQLKNLDLDIDNLFG